LYIITGMHRSGTSLVAHLFQEAGGDLGDNRTFHPPDGWNPDGYFEQSEILDINVPLVHGPWGRLAYLWLPSEATILRRSKKVGAEIGETAAAYHGKVVKEARFCLTLPAWLEAGAMVNGILVCLREPIAVAQSLRRRNRATITHGLRLWLAHNQRLLAAADEIPLRFISFSHLLDATSFEQEMNSAFRFFRLCVPREHIEKVGKIVIKAALDHHDIVNVRYPDVISSMWDELRQRHADQPHFIIDR
jgi:hypothetical protein